MVRARYSGFTLLEMLVVLTICSLLMAAVPSITSGIPTVRFGRAVEGLVIGMRRARVTALVTGRPVRMSFYPQPPRWSIAGTWHPLDAIVNHMSIELEGVKLNGSQTVTFMPDGSATGARVVLFGRTRHAAVTVNWVTGEVSRAE